MGPFEELKAQDFIYKRGIVDFDSYIDGKYYIVHNKEDYKISILDKDFSISEMHIRDGDGPGEARRVNAMFLDEKQKLIYVLRDAGILMVYDLSFKLINQYNFSTHVNAKNMVVKDGVAYFSYDHTYVPSLKNEEILLLTYVDLNSKNELSFDSFKKVYLPFSSLNIKNIKNINKLNYILFSSKLTIVNENLYVVLTGLPDIFKYDIQKSELLNVASLNEYKESMFEIKDDPRFGAGFRTPSINNAIYKNEDVIYLSQGNYDAGLPHRLFVYNPSKNAVSEMRLPSLSINSPTIKIFNGRIFVFDSMEFVSNVIEINIYKDQ